LRLPDTLSDTLDLYLIAIGGTGMAPLAALLQDQGHRVRGTDGPLYPPMSTLLERVGIVPQVGYDPAHLAAPHPDLVIVGNAVPRSNPEAQEAERLGLSLLSMPQALARFCLAGRKPLVVAGTHGKTTTSALAAHLWQQAGREPGYLVGGLPKNLPASFALGRGERFIVEGDEYNAAYFDRGAKFLHYQPELLLLTSAEHDHVDLYPTPEALYEAYGKLIELVPASGFLAACGDWPIVRELARRAACPVDFYGFGAENDVRVVGEVEAGPAGTRWRLHDPELGEVAIELGLWGPHNVANALAVWTAARRDGLPVEAIQRGLASFRGVARRLDLVGEVGGVAVIDDFAHHPTAVETTLAGLRQRFPGRRIVVLYEPRSLTAGRRFFQEAYERAFLAADRVLFAPLFYRQRLAEDDALDLPGLARVLGAAGVEASCGVSNDEVLAQAVAEARPGDVLITMSSGSFDGMPRKLVAALGAREPVL
jgi:UDP-N-acetylmuramate: L-alanyl-gamma-D-glutamyl-meso-diaminopimelate ligase